VCDTNLNPLVGGSTVTINATGGTLSGPRLEWEYPDSNQVGPDLPGHLWLIQFIVKISDDNPGGGPDGAEIKVDIVWQPELGEEETWTYKITGVIH
jgi:hypothetical protein